MSESTKAPQYQESTITDEPILGPVLFLPDGSIRQLSWFERLLVALRLTSAKDLGGSVLQARVLSCSYVPASAVAGESSSIARSLRVKIANSGCSSDGRPNPSLEGTSTGKPLGPRGGVVHHPPRGPSASPLPAPQLKR